MTVFLGDRTGLSWKELKLSGLPNGEQPDPGDIYNGGWAFDLWLKDMNGDGILDVVASYFTGPRVWHGDGKGRFRDSSQGLIKTRLGGIYGRIATGDLDRDGRPDIVIANNYNGAEAYLQRPDGSWQGPIDVMPELKGGAQSVAVADFDGDGNPDVVIGGAMSPEPNYEWIPYGLYVRWGNGRGIQCPPGDRPAIDRARGDLGYQCHRREWRRAPGSRGQRRGRVGPDIRPTTWPVPGSKAVAQQAYPAPNVQVWLNEAAARP
ncbi:MAG: VCBS repeat-containing protein [Betaproteobacteria bacterium]|nr:VCBS repeat-containing protein [Betaproteobacteria bacterium]